ncbi:MAG: phosphoserine transaminase [Hyphomicrobiales bacterium]
MTEPIKKPALRPVVSRFSCGPCTKFPGWSPDILKNACLGRSHCSAKGREKLKRALTLTRKVLQAPDSHLIAIVPASDTGAMELAMWSLLGVRGVDVLAWDAFGARWGDDIVNHLKLVNARIIGADYGALPDLSAVDFSRDVIFTWNGTSSGVRVPDGEWIPDSRHGLTICDATSAAFAQRLEFHKLDVVTFSWQKALGGEAQHGILILSPRAVERLESYTPPWPLPKLFRMTREGKLNTELFEGVTINTPSMLCVEDYLMALQWACAIGGLEALIARADDNARIIAEWVGRTRWVSFLARDVATRSNTSVCLRLSDAISEGLSAHEIAALPGRIVSLLEAQGVCFDIASHRNAPAGLRIWCGPTVEKSDIAALPAWLDWAFEQTLRELRSAA